jgi:hypothetical protein
MFEVTYQGVQAWFKDSVEKFGWMIIFSGSDSVPKEFINEKLKVYLDSLQQLKLAVADVHKRSKSEDRKEDMQAVKAKLDRFIIAAEAILRPVIQAGGSKNHPKKNNFISYLNNK